MTAKVAADPLPPLDPICPKTGPCPCDEPCKWALQAQADIERYGPLLWPRPAPASDDTKAALVSYLLDRLILRLKEPPAA